jgi:uncharacterized membrane protein YgdD (TMEM256/DUF423 family)
LPLFFLFTIFIYLSPFVFKSDTGTILQTAVIKQRVMEKLFVVLGSISAFLGIALGAFGAHVLKGKISEEMLAVFETGVKYQMYHALALLALAFAQLHWPEARLELCGWLFAAGIILFSGSLYALALTGIKFLGIITPFGGLCFLAGWAWFAFQILVSH